MTRRLVELAKDQLTVPRTRDTLLASEASKDLRTYFHDRGFGHEELGFSLISPDLTNIFSMRDVNVGRRSLIAEQRPDQLQMAFSGETVSSRRSDRMFLYQSPTRRRKPAHRRCSLPRR